MKKIFKTAAAVSVAAAVACSAGCGGNTKWSFKSGDNELTNGNWIFETYIGTMNAVSKISEGNSEKNIQNIDFEKEEIEGSPAKDWIYMQAKIDCKRQLTLDNLMKKYGATVDQSEADSMKQMYVNYFYSGSKELYEKLGVSEDSFVTAYVLPNLKSSALFNKLYGKGGEKAVSDEEMNKYFTENYVTYYTLTYNLKTSNDSGESMDISDEQKDIAETNFRKYVKMLNEQGKTTQEVSDQYKVDFSVETAPATNETTLASDMEDEDLKKEVEAAEVKKAKTVTIHDTLYLIYKGDINEKVADLKYPEDIKEDDTTSISRLSVARNMKTEEYEDFLDKEIDKLDYTRNDDCIAKYSVMRTVGIIKEEEKKNASK